jgi:methionyl-tRNA formyltransferase
MNIVFFGSSNFAVPSLRTLIKSVHKILYVVTQPDRKKGRGLHLEGTAVKLVALELGLKIYQPQSINADEAIQFLKTQDAGLFIVISYGQILSQSVLDIPKLFAINAHASLLPKYRGAAPINWAIIKGEKKSGITIMRMVKKMDAGPIIMQQEIDIQEPDTAITLEQELSEMAAKLLIPALEKIENKTYNLIPQDESKAGLAPKLKKEDGLIHWQMSASRIHNLIRGCLAWPGAFTYYNGKLLKIYRARVVRLTDCSINRTPGKILKISKEGLIVATAEEDLMIEELQMEGKKIMQVEEFIAGHKICVGEILGKK